MKALEENTAKAKLIMVYWLQPSLVLIFTLSRCKQNKQVCYRSDLEHKPEKVHSELIALLSGFAGIFLFFLVCFGFRLSVGATCYQVINH